MLTEIVPGLEYISFQRDKVFGAELEGVVESLCRILPKTDKDLKPIIDCVEKHTNLKLGCYLTSGLTAGIFVRPLQGYSGVDGHAVKRLRDPELSAVAKQRIGSTSKPFFVDFKHAKIGGNVSWFDARLVLGAGLFSPSANFSTAEITAIILHEIGHAFNELATIGDFVWLNYALTEGVEVLRGEKKRRVEFKLATNEELAKRVSDPTKAQAIKDGSAGPEAYREVLIEQFQDHRRQHLGSTHAGEQRSEQLADLFTSRMGYGRANVTAMDKISRQTHPRYYRSKGVWAMVELCKALILTTPLTIIFSGSLGFLYLIMLGSIEFGYDANKATSMYGSAKQRIKRTRNDAVVRLKLHGLTDDERQEAYDDIKAIDILLKDMNERPTVYEALLYMAVRPYRRKIQKLNQESVLEELLNNDLFVDAYTASKLT